MTATSPAQEPPSDPVETITTAAENLAAEDEDIEYFEKKIRPLLAEHCYACHARDAKTIHGGLLLDNSVSLLKGGDSGPAVVPGKPEESLLIASVHYSSSADYQMPPKGKLSDPEIAELTNWVKRGAPFPAEQDVPHAQGAEIDFVTAKQFWSFVPVQQQELPLVAQQDWPQQRIDHFVLAAMETQGLSPATEAPRVTLLRRLSFDLTGLPPTPEEVAEFVNDSDPQAYVRQVDRLLSSPHFGERWGRVWLDLARYTDRTASWLDSTGQAYLYRDWVVRAMNEDLPYDQFVERQLATDMIPETGPEDTVALGFIGLSPSYWKELQLPTEIIKVIVADEWEERIDAFSRTFLGLTVACARCHDHKFDPITMHDYYALAGVFASSRMGEVPTIDADLFAPVRQARTEVVKLEQEITALKKKKPVPDAEIATLMQQVEQLKQSTPHYDTLMAPGVVDEALFVERKGETPQSGSQLIYRPEARDLHLFLRGNPNKLGEVVPRRFLQVLSPDTPTPFQQGSGRLELARSITHEAAPLAARVIVNRIWQGHFGRGLVSTPSNFGFSGERPTHPELLDDLAARFIAGGWTLKQLHREIVLSATYRQASRVPAEKVERDPENIWLSRMNRSRLSVEAWRDAMLAVSGDLDRSIGGPSLEISSPENRRRTLYGTIHRREMSTMLLMHDFPDPNAHSEQRISTTTALQGLYVLNGPLLLDRATALVKRLETLAADEDRIRMAYQLLYSRVPTSRELELGLGFVSRQSELGESPNTDSDSWVQYAHVLLASNEFLFVD